MIWEKDFYRADINAVFNSIIVEYDLKRANTSIAREFHLLPEEQIKELEALPKKDREIQVGLLKRSDKEYSEREKEGFRQARKLFCEKNQITEADVIHVRRDSYTLLGFIDHEQVTKNLNFRKQHVYTSYVALNVDIFYNKEGLDIKGIDDEVYKEFHAPYFGSFLHRAIGKKETADQEEINEYLADFWDRYKHLQLPADFYREFNPQSRFHYKDGSCAQEEYLQDLSQLDISFNMQLITKLTQLLL